MPISETVSTTSRKKSSKKGWLVLLIVIILVAATVYFVVMKPGFITPPAANAPVASTKASSYKAVFLNNNQVYFGKLDSSMGSQFIELVDIYYLQVQQQIQPAADTENQPNISLVKLGGELHGPTDRMYINRDQVLLIEDLRSDSNLVQAIENYKNAQNQ